MYPAGEERLEVRGDGGGPTVSDRVHAVHNDCHSRCASFGPAHYRSLIIKRPADVTGGGEVAPRTEAVLAATSLPRPEFLWSVCIIPARCLRLPRPVGREGSAWTLGRERLATFLVLVTMLP